MPDPRSTLPDLAEAQGLLVGSAGYLRARLGEIDEAALDRPTRLPGWSIKDLVEHVAAAADELVGRAGGTLTERSEDDPVAMADAGVRNLVEQVSNAPTDESRWAGSALGGAIELAAHGWDLWVASGRDAPPLEDAHARAVLAIAETLVDDEVRAQHFADVVPLPSDALAFDRLAGFLGREPS